MAAYRVGEDGNGKLGIGGYLQWVAVHHPKAVFPLLVSLMELQELEIGLPEKPRPTVDQHKAQAHRQSFDPDLPWAWTGRDDEVGQLMNLAITNPNEFCTLLQAMLPRPTALQRGLAARRALEQRWAAEERERTEQHRVEEATCSQDK